MGLLWVQIQTIDIEVSSLSMVQTDCEGLLSYNLLGKQLDGLSLSETLTIGRPIQASLKKKHYLGLKASKRIHGTKIFIHLRSNTRLLLLAITKVIDDI